MTRTAKIANLLTVVLPPLIPRSATHGLGRLELDPSAAVIWSMEKLGLVWDVVRITPERQTQRLAP